MDIGKKSSITLFTNTVQTCERCICCKHMESFCKAVPMILEKEEVVFLNYLALLLTMYNKKALIFS